MEKKEKMTRINVIVREEATDKEISTGYFHYDKCIKCCGTYIIGAINNIEEYFQRELKRKDFYIDVRSIVSLVDNSKCEEGKIKGGQEEER